MYVGGVGPNGLTQLPLSGPQPFASPTTGSPPAGTPSPPTITSVDVSTAGANVSLTTGASGRRRLRTEWPVGTSWFTVVAVPCRTCSTTPCTSAGCGAAATACVGSCGTAATTCVGGNTSCGGSGDGSRANPVVTSASSSPVALALPAGSYTLYAFYSWQSSTSAAAEVGGSVPVMGVTAVVVVVCVCGGGEVWAGPRMVV